MKPVECTVKPENPVYVSAAQEMIDGFWAHPEGFVYPKACPTRTLRGRLAIFQINSARPTNW